MVQEKNDRIVCLFGSGISAPAGIPMTGDITKRILPLRGFRRGGDMLFELCEPGGRRTLGWLPELFGQEEIQEQQDIRNAVNTVFDVITEVRSAFNDAGALINYEDLVYALDRLWHLESGSPFDPLAALMREVLLKRLYPHPGAPQRLGEILGISLHCVLDLVSKELALETPSPTHLAFISQLAQAIGPANVTVLTTNHDTLLEQYLASTSEPVEDGFTAPTDGSSLSRWSPERLNQEQVFVRLLKLHGSLDWHWLSRREPPTIPDILARGRVESLEEWASPGKDSASENWEVNDRSVILVGSYNKAERYTSGIFGEVFWHARREVMGARRVLVCGYGFRDVGVNMLLVDWVSSTPDGRLLVLAHRGVEELTAKLDPWMRRWFKALRTKGVLVSIEHVSIQDLSWTDHIAPCLRDSAASQ